MTSLIPPEKGDIHTPVPPAAPAKDNGHRWLIIGCAIAIVVALLALLVKGG